MTGDYHFHQQWMTSEFALFEVILPKDDSVATKTARMTERGYIYLSNKPCTKNCDPSNLKVLGLA